MKSILLVFLGGGLGSLLRYGISRAVLLLRYHGLFPLATFITNILASVLLALMVYHWLGRSSEHLRLFLITGFCGGFSTFSTFSYENWQLAQQGHWWVLLANVLLSVLLSIAIFALVYRLALPPEA